MEAWSIAIPITLNQREMDEKLRIFKEKIKLKKCSLGFVCAPAVTVQPKGVVCYTENFDLMKRIKEFLPNIKFFGAFGDDKHSYFGYDSLNQGNSINLYIENIIIYFTKFYNCTFLIFRFDSGIPCRYYIHNVFNL